MTLLVCLALFMGGAIFGVFIMSLMVVSRDSEVGRRDNFWNHG